MMKTFEYDEFKFDEVFEVDKVFDVDGKVVYMKKEKNVGKNLKKIFKRFDDFVNKDEKHETITIIVSQFCSGGLLVYPTKSIRELLKTTVEGLITMINA